jgi:hypothetical protein
MDPGRYKGGKLRHNYPETDLILYRSLFPIVENENSIKDMSTGIIKVILI